MVEVLVNFRNIIMYLYKYKIISWIYHALLKNQIREK